MDIKLRIQKIVEEVLETYPRLKKDIVEGIDWKIIKGEQILIRYGSSEYESGWKCVIATKYSQFEGKNGFISFTFDEEGELYSSYIYDYGRGEYVYFSKNFEGKYIALDKPDNVQ